MARIGHNVPLNALDHVTNLLKDSAGKDGVVSRQNAEELGKSLRRDGRGTEALAAGKIFRMVDSFDAKPGARVTAQDLDGARSFVENEILESADTNRNGYSQSEVENMPTTGRALVEIGLKLEAAGERHPSRIAHSVPEQGLKHTAELIRQAANGDGITSRDDREQLVSTLYREGRGTEALAVSYFFGFMDARDHAPGARITEADISKATDYAGEKLLRNKDKNHNGYSKAEVSKFSTSAKTFLEIGQMLEDGIIK
jgi:hypothetical protein